MLTDGTPQPYLRPADAAKFIGSGISTLWERVKHDKDFPRPIKLSSKTTVFRSADLIAWVESKAVREAA